MTASVTITESGREGSLQYSDGARSIRGHWSFGGGDVLAIVAMGSRADWSQAHPWALERRAAILRFVADEVRRQRAPSSRVEIDEASGDILLRQDRAAAARTVTTALDRDSTPQASAAKFVRRHSRLRAMLATAVLAAVAVVAAVLWVGKKSLVVAPATGVPLNASVRTDAHVATLIQSTDPHLPRITGRGGDTTTSIRLLLVPLDGSESRVVPVVNGLPGNGHQLARIFGSDGHTIWFDAAGLYGVRLVDHGLVTAAQLRRANPALDPRWWDDPRGMDVVDGSLQVVNADRSAALVIDPVTLAASLVVPAIGTARITRQRPEDLLAAGFVLPTGGWFGVHSPDELAREFGPGKWVRPVEAARRARQSRRLFAGETGESADGRSRRIERIAPLGDAEFHDAALIRSQPDAPPLQLAAPAGALLMYTSVPGARGTAVIARIDLDGRLVWNGDTGLDRFQLQQVLPGPATLALVGTRPPVAGKPGEPLVVLVDTGSGRMTRHSLWR